MIPNPEPGGVYWCIRPPLESEGYGDTRPREPWRGELSESRGVLHLHRIGESGRADLDPNAGSIVTPRDLYPAQATAR